ncbi:ABC transporter ATP-binding protein [Geodermatophilus sp. SYSU D01036]
MTTPTTDAPPLSVPAGEGRVRLAAEGLRLAYDDRVVVDGLDLALTDGSFTAVVGPNGCGKSTLLRALGRLLRPAAGQVLLDGRAIAKTPVAPSGLTVADLVARGRHPHQSWLRQWSTEDEAVVAEALTWTDMSDLADRPVDELSGGQRQRAWISMALAQGTDLILLDEPTTYLDLSHQIDVLELVSRLHAERGRTVVVVLHDLNLAARYAQRLVAMRDGVLVASGTPHEVLTEQLLADVFDLEARVVPDPVAGTPMVVPVRRLPR